MRNIGRIRVAQERVLSVEPSFDIDAITTGQAYANEIVQRRTPGGELKPDTRPSIGNAALAVSLKSESELRDYFSTRFSQRSTKS